MDSRRTELPIDVESAGFISDKALREYLLDQVTPGMEVCDMGAARCKRAIISAYRGAEVDAVDIHQPTLQVAALRLSRTPKNIRSRVRLINSDLFSNPEIGNKRYDLIVFSPPRVNERAPSNNADSLRIIEDSGFRLIQRFLSEASLHLNDSGRLVIAYGDEDGMDSDGYVCSGEQQTLERFSSKKWDICRMLCEPEIGFAIYELRLKAQLHRELQTSATRMKSMPREEVAKLIAKYGGIQGIIDCYGLLIKETAAEMYHIDEYLMRKLEKKGVIFVCGPPEIGVANYTEGRKPYILIPDNAIPQEVIFEAYIVINQCKDRRAVSIEPDGFFAEFFLLTLDRHNRFAIPAAIRNEFPLPFYVHYFADYFLLLSEKDIWILFRKLQKENPKYASLLFSMTFQVSSLDGQGRFVVPEIALKTVALQTKEFLMERSGFSSSWLIKAISSGNLQTSSTRKIPGTQAATKWGRQILERFFGPTDKKVSIVDLDLSKAKECGKGGYAKVFKVPHKNNGKFYALKVYCAASEKISKMIDFNLLRDYLFWLSRRFAVLAKKGTMPRYYEAWECSIDRNGMPVLATVGEAKTYRIY